MNFTFEIPFFRRGSFFFMRYFICESKTVSFQTLFNIDPYTNIEKVVCSMNVKKCECMIECRG